RGANGLPLWQSYIAGLNPRDPNSQFRLEFNRASAAAVPVLTWNTVTGRFYTVWWSTNLFRAFTPLPGATNLPWTVQSFTNAVRPWSPGLFSRLEVRKP